MSYKAYCKADHSNHALGSKPCEVCKETLYRVDRYHASRWGAKKYHLSCYPKAAKLRRELEEGLTGSKPCEVCGNAMHRRDGENVNNWAGRKACRGTCAGKMSWITRKRLHPEQFLPKTPAAVVAAKKMKRKQKKEPKPVEVEMDPRSALELGWGGLSLHRSNE